MVSLVACGVILTRPEGHPAAILLPIMPGLALAASIWSARRLRDHTALRIGWWTASLAGWIIIASLATNRWNSADSSSDKRTMLILAAGAMFIVGIWAAAKIRKFPRIRTFAHASAALALLAALIGAARFAYAQRVAKVSREAEARWAAIGRPLEEVGQSIQANAANVSLPILAEILKTEFGAPIYKPASYTHTTEWSAIEDDVIAVVNRELPTGDVLSPDGKPRPELDARRERLGTAYERLLAAESPTWAADPREGFTMAVPNALALRRLAQLVAADATRRLESGDCEGARKALTAGLHANARLRDNPTIVSVLVHAAVDALLRRRAVWLPAQPGAMEALKADAAAWRNAFGRSLEYEGWTMRFAATGQIAIDQPASRRWPKVPALIESLASDRLFQEECWATVLVIAEGLAILKDPATLTLDDLGESLWAQALQRNETIYASNFSRAHMRLEATLLLREQTELLRLARSRLNSGLPLEDHDSVVLPGRRWVFTQKEPGSRSASLKLDRIPKWLETVTDQHFWALPIDGSKEWVFDAPALAATPR